MLGFTITNTNWCYFYGVGLSPSFRGNSIVLWANAILLSKRNLQLTGLDTGNLRNDWRCFDVIKKSA